MRNRWIGMFGRAPKKKYTCPCCGYKTLAEKLRGSHEICGICFWEDDPVQNEDPAFEGGANKVSLKRAQKNFQLFGASEKEFIDNVRRPAKKDVQDPDFKTIEENNFRAVQIKDWLVVVDAQATRRAYEKLSSGAEGCGCDDCKWFVQNRDWVLRDEFKDLLKSFGVDDKKDAEVTCVDLSADEKLYGGWFHAHGEVVKGQRDKIAIKNKVPVVEMRFVALAPDFGILFSNKCDLAQKDFPRPIFQIEFSAQVRRPR